MRNGLTIGHVAAFAGVTVKTVQHYHRLGPAQRDTYYSPYVPVSSADRHNHRHPAV